MIPFKPAKWLRVSKSFPCKVCQKIDWCCFTDEVSLCMRVESATPSKGNSGGWLHFVDLKKTHTFVLKLREAVKEPIVDCASMFQAWQEKTDVKDLISFCEGIGIEPMAMHMIGCAWSSENQAWAMPMRDVTGKIIGIRLRALDGSKWSVKGSKAGLFFPINYSPKAPLIITEGPTDCAAALALGFSSIGRQSCMGQHDLINDFIALNRLSSAIIVSDHDKAKLRPNGTEFFPGQEGSYKLQNALKVKSLRLILPCKDLREFIGMGGTRQMIDGFIKTRVWKLPSV